MSIYQSICDIYVPPLFVYASVNHALNISFSDPPTNIVPSNIA